MRKIVNPKFTFSWCIRSIALLPNVHREMIRLESEPFKLTFLGGFEFKLELYVRQNANDVENYVYICIRRMPAPKSSREENVKAVFACLIMFSTGEKRFAKYISLLPNQYCEFDIRTRRPDPIFSKDFKQIPFEINCHFDQSSAIFIDNQIWTYQGLSRDLETLVNGAFSDVLLRCGGKEFKVHKNILRVRAESFMRRLGLNFEEAERRVVIDVQGMSPHVLGTILFFCYTGRLDTDSFTPELINATKQHYELNDLAHKMIIFPDTAHQDSHINYVRKDIQFLLQKADYVADDLLTQKVVIDTLYCHTLEVKCAMPVDFFDKNESCVTLSFKIPAFNRNHPVHACCRLVYACNGRNVSCDLKNFFIEEDWAGSVFEISLDTYAREKKTLCLNLIFLITDLKVTSLPNSGRCRNVPPWNACTDVFASLSLQMSNIFSNDMHADCVVECQGVQFKAHSNVLFARSQFFEDYLEKHPDCIREDGKIIIDGVDEEDMLIIFRFIYSGHVPRLRHDIAMRIYRIARVLQISDLVKKCSAFLMADIGENYRIIRDLSDHYRDSYLNKHIEKYESLVRRSYERLHGPEQWILVGQAEHGFIRD